MKTFTTISRKFTAEDLKSMPVEQIEELLNELIMCSFDNGLQLRENYN